MKIKILNRAVLGLFYSLLFNPFQIAINAEEVDNGLVIVDRKPWKTSWVQEEKNWILIAHFDAGSLKTYFKNAPPAKGFGLSANKKPIKQEFEFHSGKKFTSTNSQFEQWPDGAKAYAFTYEEKLERGNNKYQFGTTAIIEEVDGNENEIRYSIFRTYK